MQCAAFLYSLDCWMENIKLRQMDNLVLGVHMLIMNGLLKKIMPIIKAIETKILNLVLNGLKKEENGLSDIMTIGLEN